jgi:tRNA(Arg) A34 adenosine deaminase TadA
MNQLSTKYQMYVTEAAAEARMSQANYKVGAIIARKNQIVARGHNDNNRTQVLRRYRDASTHAEMTVANQLVNRFVRRQAQRYRFSSRQEPKGSIL